MKVLSLFDGMSCGQIALKNSKIEIKKYFSSEIKAHAIKCTQYNFPKTIQIDHPRLRLSVLIKQPDNVEGSLLY